MDSVSSLRSSNGAGPRASQYIVMAAKAKAILAGSTHVKPEHIRAVAKPVMRHRIITNFNAEAEGIKPDDIVRRLAAIIRTDPSKATIAAKLPDVFKSSEGG